MFRLWAAILISISLVAPAWAAYTPAYAAAQIDNNTISGLVGYQVDSTWWIEAHASHYANTIKQAGASSETQILAIGISALYMIPLKLSGGSPYYFFGKVGFEHAIEDVSYSFPASVTYSGSYTNRLNRGRFGIGAQYDFYEHLSGRAGIDAFGPDRSVYLTAIFKF